MSLVADLLLSALVVLGLYAVATSRLTACVRASALQGIVLGLLAVVLAWEERPAALSVHDGVLALGALAIKGGLIPQLLLRAIRQVGVRREVEPMVSLHASVLAGVALVAVAFWLGARLAFPFEVASPLLFPAAISNVLLGFLLVVARRKAITQVVGYLVLENGVFLVGLALAQEQPIAVELSVLLDLLVAVFVMGIAIHHISRTFDHIDTGSLAELRE